MENFSIGQVWSYNNRPQDQDSSLTIVHIDNANDTTIIHIALQGVKVKNSTSPNGYTNSIGHLPVGIEAMRESVRKLQSTVDTLPDYEDGYKQWKTAFDSGDAGFFSIPVCEIVNYVEQTLI